MVLIKRAISLRVKVILEGPARLTGFQTHSHFNLTMFKTGWAMASTSFKANLVRFKINFKTLTLCKWVNNHFSFQPRLQVLDNNRSWQLRKCPANWQHSNGSSNLRSTSLLSSKSSMESALTEPQWFLTRKLRMGSQINALTHQAATLLKITGVEPLTTRSLKIIQQLQLFI